MSLLKERKEDNQTVSSYFYVKIKYVKEKK